MDTGCFVPLDLWLLHLKSMKKRRDPVTLSRPLGFAAQGLSYVLWDEKPLVPCWNFSCFCDFNSGFFWSSFVKWTQPWVLLGGFLGIILYNDSKEPDIVKSKGPRPSAQLYLHYEHKSSFKTSTLKLLSFTKPCGPNGDEQTVCSAHSPALEAPSS